MQNGSLGSITGNIHLTAYSLCDILYTEQDSFPLNGGKTMPFYEREKELAQPGALGAADAEEKARGGGGILVFATVRHRGDDRPDLQPEF